jgi:hypothetical protein
MQSSTTAGYMPKMSQGQGETDSESSHFGNEMGTGMQGQASRSDHTEGTLARLIEEQTAKLPSDLFLWGAIGSIGCSLLLQASDRKQDALFVGQWAPTLLILGLYNKIVKIAGSDSVHRHGS